MKYSGGSKSKALSYLRDIPADPNVPVTLEAEIHLKVTYIDGKRSPDRSWRTVTAELRGTKLKMTIHREGKSNHVSTIFYIVLYYLKFFFLVSLVINKNYRICVYRLFLFFI